MGSAANEARAGTRKEVTVDMGRVALVTLVLVGCGDRLKQDACLDKGRLLGLLEATLRNAGPTRLRGATIGEVR